MPFVSLFAAVLTLAPQDPAPPAPIVAAAEAVRAQVAKLCGRELHGALPTEVMDAKALRAYTTGRLDIELGDGRLERMEAWLHCLRLLPEGARYREAVTELLVGQIAAVYDSDQRVLRLLDDTTKAGDWYTRYTLAHEVSHALDDQELELRRLLEPEGRDLTKDEMFAVSGAVEGSAIATSDAWAATEPPPEGYDPMADADTRATVAKANAALLAAPPYCTLVLARHALGARFFAEGKRLCAIKAGEYLGLLTIADDLPASSEQLLHPETYWQKDARQAPVRLVDEDAVAASIAKLTGRRVVDRNTLGELVCGLLAQPIDRKLNPAATRRVSAWTNQASTGWGGDRLFVVGDGGGTAGEPVTAPGVVWITAWDTLTDRAEFVAAISQHRAAATGMGVRTAGRTAAFTFGSARAIADQDLDALLAACRFEQADQAWER